MHKIILILVLISAYILPQQSNSLQLKNDADNIPAVNNLNSISLEVPKKKNAGLAIIYSLLLPGMGELYAEGYSSGKYFTIAEGALWLSYIGMNTYGNWQEDRYKSFASSNGNVDPTGKDNEYYATISEYFNIEEYNTEQALNRSFDEMFNSNEFYWNWENPADRRAYRDMWVSSEQAYNNLRFIIGGLVVNRLVSAINAVRLVSAYNRRITEQTWNVSVSPDLIQPGVRLNFVTSF